MKNFTRNRLESLKAKAAKCNNAHFKEWHKHVPKLYIEPIHKNSECWVVYKPEKFGLIEITNKPRNLSNWYCDSFQNDTYNPCVFVLRGKKTTKSRGSLWVFTGYFDTVDEAYILEKPFLTDYDIGDNSYIDFNGLDGFEYSRYWRYAERYAEKSAEETREFHAKDQAEQCIEALREQIHTINAQVLPLIKEVKGQQYSHNVCLAIKGTIRTFLSTRKQAFKEIKQYQENYWLAVE